MVASEKLNAIGKLGDEFLSHTLEARTGHAHFAALVIELLDFFHCESEVSRDITNSLINDMDMHVGDGHESCCWKYRISFDPLYSRWWVLFTVTKY